MEKERLEKEIRKDRATDVVLEERRQTRCKGDNPKTKLRLSHKQERKEGKTQTP